MSEEKYILIVEDERDLLKNLCRFFSLKGFRVSEATDGQTAFRLIKQESPDLIISDLGMPFWDGHRLLEELQKDTQFSTIPVIILTAWTQRERYRKTMEHGAVDYITKPFSLAELYRSVDSQLKKKVTMEKIAKLAARDEVVPSLFGYLPHELRTPLNGITGITELLEFEAPENRSEQFREYNALMQTSASRLLRVIENLEFFFHHKPDKKRSQSALDFRRNSKGVNARTCLDNVVSQIREMHGASADRFEIVEKAMSTIMDAKDLEKCLYEILDNAVKFSNSDSLIRVYFEQVNDFLCILVENEGNGFNPEKLDLESGFQQLNRETNEQQGLGLGLCITNLILKKAGGALEISSRPEGNTQVRLFVPSIMQTNSACQRAHKTLYLER